MINYGELWNSFFHMVKDYLTNINKNNEGYSHNIFPRLCPEINTKSLNSRALIKVECCKDKVIIIMGLGFLVMKLRFWDEISFKRKKVEGKKFSWQYWKLR